MSDITLKWGTLKAWDFEDCPAALSAFKKYCDIGMSLSAMTQQNTPEQKQLICEMIDAVDGDIYDDWNGGTMTKEAAKKYIMKYDE